jgi:DNA-binding XRE family transcriptional regulator
MKVVKFRFMSPEQCQVARALLDLTQNQLAIAAGTSKKVVNRFEVGRDWRKWYAQRTNGDDDLIRLIQQCLTRLGIRFLFDRRGPKGVVIGDAEPVYLAEAAQTHLLHPLHFRAARAWLGWTQLDLAEAAGVSYSTIRDFEKNRRVPHRANLYAMEYAMKIQGIRFVYDRRNEPIGIAIVNGSVNVGAAIWATGVRAAETLAAAA